MALMNRQYQLDTEAERERAPVGGADLPRPRAAPRGRARAADAVAKSAGIQPPQWQSIGPGNVAGACARIAFDPSTRRASRRHRLGRPVDLGGHRRSWRANHDFLPNLSITTIAFDPAIRAWSISAPARRARAWSAWGVQVGRRRRDLDPDAADQRRRQRRLALREPARRATRPAAVLLAASPTTTAWRRHLPLRRRRRHLDAGRAHEGARHRLRAGNPATRSPASTTAPSRISRDAGLTWTRSPPLLAADGQTPTRAEIAFARSQPGVAYASFDTTRARCGAPTTAARLEQDRHAAHLAARATTTTPSGSIPPTRPRDRRPASTLPVARRAASPSQGERLDLTPPSPHADHHALVSPPISAAGRCSTTATTAASTAPRTSAR
jgi:hypothetical protein